MQLPRVQSPGGNELGFSAFRIGSRSKAMSSVTAMTTATTRQAPRRGRALNITAVEVCQEPAVNAKLRKSPSDTTQVLPLCLGSTLRRLAGDDCTPLPPTPQARCT